MSLVGPAHDERADSAVARLERLQRLTSGLSRAVTVDGIAEVAEVAVHGGLAGLAADDMAVPVPRGVDPSA